jgi:hypothetical protein
MCFIAFQLWKGYARVGRHEGQSFDVAALTVYGK